MTWTTHPNGLDWGTITNLEAKQVVGKQLAQRLQDGDVVGVGSGSTAYVALNAIAERAQHEHLTWTAIASSVELGMACQQLGIRTTELPYARPDWSFDGADEVDPDHRLIKGRGGALLKEKMLLAASHHPMIVVDASKHVDRLGSRFPVPVEIDPWAVMLVTDALHGIAGVREVTLRSARGSKDGPVLTERGNLILDVTFDEIGPHTNTTITMIPGVFETGIFEGFNLEVLTL